MTATNFFLFAVFGLGSSEMLLILLAVLLIFGPSNLPKLADALGKAIRNFKKSATEDTEETKEAASEATPPKKDAS